jgi:hypothetical protein
VGDLGFADRDGLQRRRELHALHAVDVERGVKRREADIAADQLVRRQVGVQLGARGATMSVASGPLNVKICAVIWNGTDLGRLHKDQVGERPHGPGIHDRSSTAAITSAEAVPSPTRESTETTTSPGTGDVALASRTSGVRRARVETRRQVPGRPR